MISLKFRNDHELSVVLKSLPSGTDFSISDLRGEVYIDETEIDDVDSFMMYVVSFEE